ncbi:OmpA family protein [Lunatibacter salilacus]|uniref:OmpA family protein n=1 Tax=Lunatibacter salilacus TaxID=2483804 RepID=UPI00131DEC4B|nr:OmpA family protein [Lunatibacter salilacus]
MKKIFTLIAVLALSATFSWNAYSQKGLLRYADHKLEQGNYLEAGQGFEKAYSRKPTYQAAVGAAEAYSKLRDYQKIYQWRKNAASFDEADADDVLFYIAGANQVGNLEEVKSALDSLRGRQSGPIEHLQLDSLRHWYTHPSNAEMVNVPAINTASSEFGMTKDNRGNTYFSSDRGTAALPIKRAIRIDKGHKYYNRKADFTGRDFLGIYKVNSEGAVEEYVSPVPDVFHLADPFFMESKPVVFYTVTRAIKKSKNYDVYPEVYFSQLDDAGKMTDYTAFPVNSATDYGVISPFVDEQAKRVYFSSNMEGGQGGYDLYYVSYDEDMKFGDPVNLGAVVNTPGNERDPYLNENKFYFSSDGHIGLGGLDMFVSHLENGDFRGVKNLGIPYNSPQDDFGLYFSGEGDVYLASNRPESRGLDDIFLMAELYKRFQARVQGCDGELIDGQLEILLMEGKDRVNRETSQDGKGFFSAELAPDADFEVVIRKSGYFALKDNQLTTRNLLAEELSKTYQLVRIPYQTAVYVDLVYYNLDESAIREDAEGILAKVAELLKSYSFIDISIRSHTDARASNAYNEALSERRANAVRDYLGQFGVARSRVRSEWFGEEQLVNDCGDGVPCPEPEHQLNRRSELILLAFPEKDRAYDMPPELEGIDLCDISNIQVPMDMPTVYFGFDRADLKPEDKQALQRVALMLENMLTQRLAIKGHTDNRGGDNYNQKLSEKRALVVKKYLEGRGIASDRIVYEFFGKSKPINDCDALPCTSEMHRINRRTELSLPELNSNWMKDKE